MGMQAECRRRQHPVSADLRRRIEADYIACFYCGDSLARRRTFPPTLPPEADHVVSLEAGGTSAPDNLVMACAACNRSKQEKSVTAFVVYLREFWTRFGLWGIDAAD